MRSESVLNPTPAFIVMVGLNCCWSGQVFDLDGKLMQLQVITFEVFVLYINLRLSSAEGPITAYFPSTVWRISVFADKIHY